MDYQKLADELFEAEQSQITVVPLSERFAEMTVDDAYAIQELNIKRKLANGSKVTGKKIGLTSAPMQELLGVNVPDYGILLDDMLVTGNVIEKGRTIQAMIEGEFAFVLKKDVTPDMSVDDLIAAIDYVCPSIELVDSRVTDWKIKIVDTVADNASCALYVLSDEKIDPSKVDLARLELEIYKNGEFVNRGTGADVMGNPMNAVLWLAESLGKYGVDLNAGDVILSGALTAAIRAESGDEFELRFGDYGKLELRFE